MKFIADYFCKCYELGVRKGVRAGLEEAAQVEHDDTVLSSESFFEKYGTYEAETAIRALDSEAIAQRVEKGGAK